MFELPGVAQENLRRSFPGAGSGSKSWLLRARVMSFLAVANPVASAFHVPGLGVVAVREGSELDQKDTCGSKNRETRSRAMHRTPLG